MFYKQGIATGGITGLHTLFPTALKAEPQGYRWPVTLTVSRLPQKFVVWASSRSRLALVTLNNIEVFLGSRVCCQCL